MYLFFIYCTVDCVIGLVCRSVCTVAYSNNLYTVQHCNYLINPFVLITSTLFLLYCVLVLCYLLNLPFYKRKWKEKLKVTSGFINGTLHFLIQLVIKLGAALLWKWEFGLLVTLVQNLVLGNLGFRSVAMIIQAYCTFLWRTFWTFGQIYKIFCTHYLTYV